MGKKRATHTRKHGRKPKHGKKTKKHKRTATHGIKGLNATVKKLVKKITGKPFRGTIGVVSKEVLNRTTPFVYKIPMAGNKMVYIFKKSEQGFYIVLTTADNMVDNAGNIVTSVMDGATDLTILSIEMIEGH